ncbi:tetratricopeptide repeat protein [Kiritimatiellota bacterium B12222]|nr:tetratricopeptide repeat protein [Kiritimatiellota bacterium B12222]
MCLQPLRAEKPEVLVNAWQEYQFLSMETAEIYFKQALALDTDPQYLLEAKVGLAMVNQYKEQGQDLETAKKLYTQVLEQDPPTEMRQLIFSFLADLHLSQGEDEEALELLDALIAECANSVIGQDALIRKVILTMGPYGSEESVAVADEAVSLIENLSIEPTQARPYLIPLISSLLGGIYFWADDFEQSLAQSEIFTTLGNAETTSYGSQYAALYQMAKIYELELNQPEKAGVYYRRIVEDYPNSNISYYALEKAIEFKAMTRSEVEALRLPGVTPEILTELFTIESGEDD